MKSNTPKTTIIGIFALFTLIVFIGCQQLQSDQNVTSEQKIHDTQLNIKSVDHGEIEIIEIEECEYIIYKEKQGTNLAYGYMAHKGNCKNTIHNGGVLLGSVPGTDPNLEETLVSDNIESP